MRKTITTLINILIYFLLAVLLFLNYVLIESGLEPPPVTGDDGQAGMGITFFVLSIIIGIGSATVIVGLTLTKRLMSKVLTKIDIALLVLSVLLLVLDLYIYNNL